MNNKADYKVPRMTNKQILHGNERKKKNSTDEKHTLKRLVLKERKCKEVQI